MENQETDEMENQDAMRSNVDDPADDFSDDDDFWLAVTEPSLDDIWNNSEDDMYAELISETTERRQEINQANGRGEIE